MNLEANTILITGGSSGIGLELTKVLIEKGNTVIICSRSAAKLEQTKKQFPSVHIIQCDISLKSECLKLYETVKRDFPSINILINNAALVNKTSFDGDEEMISKAELEIHTNFLAPVMLTKLFLPLLSNKKNACLVYVTTGLVYAPKAVYPIYCSTKAAIHSFAQTLRIQLKVKSIKIAEVLMPAIDTPFHEGNPPKIAISAEKAVKEMIQKLEEGKTEIKIAGVKILYILSRLAPAFAIKKINSIN